MPSKQLPTNPGEHRQALSALHTSATSVVLPLMVHLFGQRGLLSPTCDVLKVLTTQVPEQSQDVCKALRSTFYFMKPNCNPSSISQTQELLLSEKSAFVSPITQLPLSAFHLLASPATSPNLTGTFPATIISGSLQFVHLKIPNSIRFLVWPSHLRLRLPTLITYPSYRSSTSAVKIPPTSAKKTPNVNWHLCLDQM